MKFISLVFFPWPQMRYTKVCENEGMIVVLNTAGSNYFARNIFYLNCEKIQNVRAFYQNVYNRCYILDIVQKHLKKHTLCLKNSEVSASRGYFRHDHLTLYKFDLAVFPLVHLEKLIQL